MFVGLDLSLTGTGLCRYEPDDHYQTACLATGPGDFANRWLRYEHLANNICEFIRNKPTKFIVLEDYILKAGSAATSIALFEYGAIVRHRLTMMDVPWITVVGSQLKKWITGHGIGDKSIIVKEVYKRLNVDVNDNNEADAVVLANMAYDLHGLKHHGRRPTFTYRDEVISKILKTRPLTNETKWVP